MNWIIFGFILSGLGAIMAFAGGVVLYIGQKSQADQQTTELNRKLDSRDSLLAIRTDQIFELNTQLDTKSDIIINLNNKLTEKSNELYKKSNQLNQMLLAEDRYPIIRFLSTGKAGSKVFTLSVYNRWPIYLEDISVTVVDYTKLAPLLTLDKGKAYCLESNYTKNIVYLSPKQFVLSSKNETNLQFKVSGKGEYSMVLRSKGRTLYQRLVFAEINNEMIYSYLITDTEDKPVDEYSNANVTWKASLDERLKAMHVITYFN